MEIQNNMTKAKELAIKATKHLDENGNEVYNVFCEAALQEMAEWKDKQYHDLIKQSNENSTRQFELGCEKERDRIIEKAVEWIKSQMIPYGASPLAIFNYIEEFKQAVKEIKNES